MFTLKIESPIYLLESTEKCYRCGAIAPVIALACLKMLERIEESEEWEDISIPGALILISNLSSLPLPIIERVQKFHPMWQKRYSKTANREYFMNTCPECDAHFGDHFLFGEPGGAFFPMNDDEASRINIHDLKLTGVFELDGTWSMGTGDVIWSHGKKLLE